MRFTQTVEVGHTIWNVWFWSLWRNTTESKAWQKLETCIEKENILGKTLDINLTLDSELTRLFLRLLWQPFNRLNAKTSPFHIQTSEPCTPLEGPQLAFRNGLVEPATQIHTFHSKISKAGDFSFQESGEIADTEDLVPGCNIPPSRFVGDITSCWTLDKVHRNLLHHAMHARNKSNFG